jgi:hypothetical protein
MSRGYSGNASLTKRTPVGLSDHLPELKESYDEFQTLIQTGAAAFVCNIPTVFDDRLVVEL